MSELKPCPSCGSTNIAIHKDVYGNFIWWGECYDCDLSTSGCDTEDRAVAAWNRRAESSAGSDTHKLSANLFELALEWKSRDCAFRDPDARYCELEKQAKALGYLDGSRL